MTPAHASKSDFEGVVVNKPWGYEYLMYQNGAVGLWYLSIRHGARTSLHCHPRKKTGFVLLDGEAVVQFLNDSMPLKPLGKLMIRPGLFHSTMALSPSGVALIEIENPCDKTNLVRLEDEYDRQEKPYEGAEALAPMHDACVRFEEPASGQPRRYQLHSCLFSVERIEDAAGLRERDLREIIVVLDGGLVSNSGEPVLSPGDVVSASTSARLAQTFAAPSGVSFLSIRKLSDA